MSGQRKVPTFLKSLMKYDAEVTERFCLYMNQFLPFRQLKTHYKLLEISCHGIPWLAGWLAFIWVLDSSSLYQMQVNFYIGLLLDIVFVAVSKAFFRRRRPPANQDDTLVIGPDVYSFPSGHASRAVFILYFFTCSYPLTYLVWPPLFAWATSICLSRVLLRRHHLLDVSAGALLGVFEGWLVSLIWLSPETSRSLVFWLTDEKGSGAEYHV